MDLGGGLGLGMFENFSNADILATTTCHICTSWILALREARAASQLFYDGTGYVRHVEHKFHDHRENCRER